MKLAANNRGSSQKKSKFNLSRRLFPLLILPALLLIGFFWQNYKGIIYPQLHQDQSSPKKYVEQKAKSLLPQEQKPIVYEHGPRDKHTLALTFDADMTPAMLVLLKSHTVKSLYNQAIKETLDRESVKATIFLGGLWTKTYPNEAKALAADPLFEIGNHSYNHPGFAINCFRLPVLSNKDDVNEVETAQQIIYQTTGILPKYFRFPGGCYEKIDVETISKLGLKIIHWDIAAGDGFNKNPDLIVQHVLSTVQNGSIVVFHIHDGPYAPKTNEALIKIIPQLKRQGYQFVTISEMFPNNN